MAEYDNIEIPIDFWKSPNVKSEKISQSVQATILVSCYVLSCYDLSVCKASQGLKVRLTQ